MPNQLQKIFTALNPFNRTSAEETKHNLSGIISPVQLQRLRQDVLSYRESIQEAESA